MLTLGTGPERQPVDCGISDEVFDQAKASGVDIGLLLQLLIAYGPQVLAILAKLFNWKIPPLPGPTPPTPPFPFVQR